MCLVLTSRSKTPHFLDRKSKDSYLSVFDEKTFVFLGSNDWDQGRSFMKDIGDPSLWSKDEESSKFYKSFLRYRAGDEVLQVGYLDLKIIRVAMDKEGFSSGKDNLVSKIGGRDRRIIEIKVADFRRVTVIAACCIRISAAYETDYCSAIRTRLSGAIFEGL
ncbi:uncharacterized protein FOBCDRAFT_196085 [Fusarium oxysporum Fo47]|uniref:uncharacterized protein n=1 Tax=Fusarium oxysporum Fo47 TaxID=660027 RepID=UPI002869DDB7|nr:uncharacterized protein FOBCDRAFT_196085 [Fusarium oxysporum Fo47]WJG34603.1 hypothetical protein FOBCDRAFT_196085 [Fusarium oxysporum Fo47]